MAACKECRYFKLQQADTGICMFNPPQSALVQIQGLRGPEMVVQSFRPVVKEAEFCSNHAFPLQ